MRVAARLRVQLSLSTHLLLLPLLVIASSRAVFTAASTLGDDASSGELESSTAAAASCPPDDQCDTKKWCWALLASDGKKAGSEDDDGAKCLDELVVDQCGCCRECVRDSPGLPCGGSRRRGVCKAPLECLADVAVGRIAEPLEEGTCHERNCSAVVCPPVASKPCPEDSYALPSKTSPKSCCPISGGCACLPNDCLGKDCQPDEVRRLVKTGNRKPGSCCDSYECVPASGDRVCHVGKETYKNGDTWHTKCSTCSCRNGVAVCNDNVCKGVDVQHCSWLHKPDGECCPVCIGCLTSSGLRFNNGERWKEDDCTWCECISGKAKCEAQMCQTKCANPVKKPGVCCPVCEKLPTTYPIHGTANHTGLSRPCPRDDRSVWRDQCRHCACLNGHEVCSLVACPRTYCEHPIMEPGACCPVCQNDAASPFHWPPAGTGVCQGLDGHVHREGDSWWLDECVRCECVDGVALCDTMQCPPAPCANPTRKQGQCCATCAEEEQQLGVSNQSNQLPCAGGYKDGQAWRPEPCLSCLCRAGKERCFREACPPLTCLEPLFLKNHCCPICPTAATSLRASPACRTDGKVYADGASWSPDNCKRCHCTMGQVQCSEMGCPPNMCRSANHTSGGCCIPCSPSSSTQEAASTQQRAQWQCTRAGLVLSDGEQRVIDNCNRCECSRGHLHCQETVCHQDLCRTHNHSSGNCCVQCTELDHYAKSSGSDVVGYVIAIVILVTLIVVLMCVACLWRRRNTRPFNKPKQHYQKTANGYV